LYVSIKKLCNALSSYLREVRTGKTITVTQHCTPVARRTPISQPTALERLVAEGLVRPGRVRERRAPTPLKTEGPVSDLISDQRR
jgi:prevent-host-death family protein